MKLADAMRKSFQDRDAEEFGKIADFCRFRLGWKHQKLVDEISRVTGCDPADVDELLYEADEVESSKPGLW